MSVPYIISTAYPDYKRPSLHQEFGICRESDVPTLFINKCAEFIFYRTSEGDIKTSNDINTFIESYFDDYYMDNLPWEANVFINGEWSNIIPSDEELFNRIQILKQNEMKDIYDNPDIETELSEDDNNLDISKEDEEFFKKFYVTLKEASNYEEADEILSDDMKIKNFIKHTFSVLNENFVKNNKELTKQFIEKITLYLDKEIKVKSIELEALIDSENDSTNKSEFVEYLTNLISLRANIYAYHQFTSELKL